MNARRLRRRELLQCAGLGVAAAALQHCAGAARQDAGRDPARRPNFVVILTDDQGYADLGCYGAPLLDTPNLDRMAAEGVRFTDFYAAAPNCSPSRAALLTGCYPTRVGLPKVLGPGSEIGISSEEVTLAELLKGQGYATACYGKWHLGDRPEFLPLRHGFDDYFGLPYSNDMWPRHPTNKSFPDLPLIDGEHAVETNPDQTQLTRRYTERAVAFVTENKDRPFFLYVPHTMPHVPLHASGKFLGKSRQGLYGDVIMEIDWSMGQILAALRRLGIDEDTFVVFSSDNGPWLSYGDHAGSAKPLREGKHTTFDGGQRVPCVMRWPGRIPAGATCHEPAAMFDLLPTFAKLAGTRPPVDRVIDGKDIWPLIACQPGAASPHEAFFFACDGELQAVRAGTWKLHLAHKYQALAEAGTGGTPGRYVTKSIGPALFDLRQDVAEEADVAAAHPDVVERLTRMATEFENDIKAHGRPPGRVEKTP